MGVVFVQVVDALLVAPVEAAILFKPDLGRLLQLGGMTNPLTQATFSAAAKPRAIPVSQSASTITSSSVKATMSPLTSAKARVRARETPGKSSRI